MSFKTVFMGTPEFSVPTLEALIKNKLNILSVYTRPPKKSKRGQKINSSDHKQTKYELIYKLYLDQNEFLFLPAIKN